VRVRENIALKVAVCANTTVVALNCAEAINGIGGWSDMTVEQMWMLSRRCNIPTLTEEQWQNYKGEDPVIIQYKAGIRYNAEFRDIVTKKSLLRT
jgi:hypothetical protein